MKKNRDQYKIYLDRLETLDSDQVLRYAAELPVDNNSVSRLHSEWQTASRELDSMAATGLGQRHPSVMVQKQRLQGLRNDLDASVSTLRESLQTNYEMISEQLLVMEGTRAEKDEELVDLATEMHDYREATRDYESSLALLQELKLKHSSERVGLRSPEGADYYSGRSQEGIEASESKSDSQPCVRCGNRTDFWNRDCLLLGIHRHLGEEPGGRREVSSSSSSGGHPQGRWSSSQAKRHEPGRRSLSYSSNQH